MADRPLVGASAAYSAGYEATFRGPDGLTAGERERVVRAGWDFIQVGRAWVCRNERNNPILMVTFEVETGLWLSCGYGEENEHATAFGAIVAASERIGVRV